MNINQVNIESWTKLDKVGQSCQPLMIINLKNDGFPGESGRVGEWVSG